MHEPVLSWYWCGAVKQPFRESTMRMCRRRHISARYLSDIPSSPSGRSCSKRAVLSPNASFSGAQQVLFFGVRGPRGASRLAPAARRPRFTAGKKKAWKNIEASRMQLQEQHSCPLSYVGFKMPAAPRTRQQRFRGSKRHLQFHKSVCQAALSRCGRLLQRCLRGIRAKKATSPPPYDTPESPEKATNMRPTCLSGFISAQSTSAPSVHRSRQPRP